MKNDYQTFLMCARNVVYVKLDWDGLRVWQQYSGIFNLLKPTGYVMHQQV